ncbi:hypothetical protein GYMLUDRAFT_1027569 [Collybiopsis luxurians FD-317 M1]|nr:hypothetical protein GYMLUDRAFT_1027569 [Collybiopsis luxurians FD-317 M1]
MAEFLDNKSYFGMRWITASRRRIIHLAGRTCRAYAQQQCHSKCYHFFNSYQVTPTRSILNLTAGKMAINVTFLSPIEPDDLVKQSFPFTYIYFEASSTDGNSHSLQIYEDISGEWISSNSLNGMQWNTIVSNTIIYHEAQRLPIQFMTETNNVAEDGVVYHVTNTGSGVAFQTGWDIVLRSLFLNNGSLVNSQDTADRAIGDRWPVLAFSRDLGTIQSTQSPVVWGIGVARNRDMIYTTTTGNQTRQPYFFTKYSDVPTAMADFMSDAANALQRAINLDSQIVSDANKISSNYADLVSLASRQAMAGMEITAGSDSNGKVNKSDILIFTKDTGNSQRTNPVETLYASFPAFLCINASWTGYLLEPLLQYGSSGFYNEDFAAGDLGNNFPSAVGNDNPLPFSAMESSSDMLIMAWAHATFSGDGSLLSSYYPTLKKWTDTLISEHPLTPNGFISADELSNANMTNLAIKGILAIRAMAEISLADSCRVLRSFNLDIRGIELTMIPTASKLHGTRMPFPQLHHSGCHTTAIKEGFIGVNGACLCLEPEKFYCVPHDVQYI